VGVRLGVKTTGCSGLAYKLEYVDEAARRHGVRGHGVKVLIDPKSLAYIDGTELDFVREGLNEGFKFNNPNERDRCGCGERGFPGLSGAGFDVNLQSDDFTLFGCPALCAGARPLDARWKELQREAHPDRFAPRGARRSAWPCSGRCASTRPTSASRTRSSAPPTCASCGGAPIKAENNTAMPPPF
jgi:iron-sulfur cluster assembly protein